MLRGHSESTKETNEPPSRRSNKESGIKRDRPGSDLEYDATSSPQNSDVGGSAKRLKSDSARRGHGIESKSADPATASPPAQRGSTPQRAPPFPDEFSPIRLATGLERRLLGGLTGGVDERSLLLQVREQRRQQPQLPLSVAGLSPGLRESSVRRSGAVSNSLPRDDFVSLLQMQALRNIRSEDSQMQALRHLRAEGHLHDRVTINRADQLNLLGSMGGDSYLDAQRLMLGHQQLLDARRLALERELAARIAVPPNDELMALLAARQQVSLTGGAHSGVGGINLPFDLAHNSSGFVGVSMHQNRPSAGNRPQGGIPQRLPAPLSQPEDAMKLSSHQVFLRQQIEAFEATEDDIATHTRGRNKPISLGQVGIRCRHCAHVPVSRRQKGSTYFPATLLGLYQAAQNQSTTHMQCGLCAEMPEETKQEFANLMASKVVSSGAGRPYWAESAKRLGLIDTEDGIRFIRSLPQG